MRCLVQQGMIVTREKSFCTPGKHHPIACSGLAQMHRSTMAPAHPTAAPAHPTPPSTAHPTVSCITWKGSSSSGSSSSNQKKPFVACTQGIFPIKSLHVGTNNNKNRALWDHHQQIQYPQEDERQSGFRKVERLRGVQRAPTYLPSSHSSCPQEELRSPSKHHSFPYLALSQKILPSSHVNFSI